jgi:hypothetical protein
MGETSGSVISTFSPRSAAMALAQSQMSLSAIENQ